MSTVSDVHTFILRRIEEQTYRPGQKLDSLRMLARDVRATPVTVSRAISQLVDAGYLSRDAGRGYVVTGIAERTRRGQTIGVLFSDDVSPLDNPIMQAVLMAVHPRMIERKISVLAIGRNNASRGGRSGHFPTPQDLADRNLDGLIVFNVYDDRYLAEVATRIKCLVALDMDTSDVGIDCIAFDHLVSGVALVKALKARGARQIAFIGGPFPPVHRSTYWLHYDKCGRERYDAWRTALAALDLDCGPRLARMVLHRASNATRDAFERMWAEGVRPDAIVTEDPHAIGICLDAHGVRPGEIPVGAWMPKGAEHAAPEHLLAAALCDFERVGTYGARMLIERMSAPDAPPERRLVAPEIWERPRSA